MLQLPVNAEELLKKYEPIVFAAGYGSGVARQNGYGTDAKPQVDILFAVDDLREWHIQNLITTHQQESN